MFGTILTVIVVILGITISIALHELGHFLPAKKFGVPATEFFVCFGRKLWSVKKGETEYGIKAVPFGGYTRIEGMFPPKPEGHNDRICKSIIEGAREESAKGMEGFDEKRAFYNLTFGKKLLIMMGGTLTNCVLGFLCFLIAFSIIGAPAATTTLGDVVRCQSQMLGEVPANSSETPDEQANLCEGDGVAPGYQAGLLPGDQIQSVNGVATPDWKDVQEQITGSEYSTIDLDVLRDGKIEDITVEALEVNGQYKIGIAPTSEIRHLSPLDALSITGQAITGTAKAIVTIPSGMVDAVRALVTNTERQEKNLVSIVGVGQVAVASEKATDDFGQKVAAIFSILGSLNIALFVLNLIPLLPLDGGHSANAIYEGIKRGLAKIRRKPRPGPADLAQSMPVAYVVYGFLILMFVIMVLADIFHPIV